MSQQTQDWDSIIEQYKASGLSQPDFCKQNSVSINKFQYRWYQHSVLEKAKAKLCNIEHRSTTALFESIKIVNPAPEPKQIISVLQLSVHLPNQIRCDIKLDTQDNALATLLKQLVTLC